MVNHIPALLGETLRGLNFKKNSLVIDATADGGGHARAILDNLGPAGRLIGTDWDLGMIERLQEELKGEKRLKLFHLNFSEIEKVAGSRRPDAILFDLGLSSLQLSASGRGFSFRASEPLEMTFNAETHPNVRELLRKISERELEEIIRTYGEEPFAKRISRAIVAARRQKEIGTAKELAEIIAKVRPRLGRIHPATKTFQALRIYVNQELENLKRGLEGAWKIIKPGGRIAVISYHSLEDRIVKNFSREKGQVAKPIRPSRAEILKNPRARSAKLRIIEKK